ncbi:ABC transporter ATP-binding protein [Mangrovicoccus ximenensis]|uniref:ABC transporter ATP-binding protein n=1 Tax=Mangrovicoccus ximenensis TaxID=1911570 RepID=UPI000D3648CB|nr:ABC transporter ATP-binding protein [Mangrovicoccus ximenensis]
MTGPVVEARGLTRRFGAKTAVDALDLSIEPGVIYGFLGPNGCGKTTAMRLLTGLLTPSAGTARVLGTELPGKAEPLKRKIGYMTQSFSHYRDLTVAENMGFTAAVYGLRGRKARDRIGALSEEYGLADLRGQMAGSLSGGQKQRLALALAVMHRPQLLFLDEPTSAVDPESRRGFWEKLFDLVAEGASIVVSTHFMDEAERCHRLAILDRGRKRADGTPQDLMDALGATVLEVEGPDLRAARRRLGAGPDKRCRSGGGRDGIGPVRAAMRPPVQARSPWPATSAILRFRAIALVLISAVPEPIPPRRSAWNAFSPSRRS